MSTKQRLGTALVLALTIAACEGAPRSNPPAATDSGTHPPATAGASPAVAPAPTATHAPPAATAFAALNDTSGKGHLRLATILSSDGTPFVGASVAMTSVALEKTYQTITLRGVVPVETKALNVGFRFNQEGAGLAPIDLRIYRITYADGGSAKNRVPNSTFESGFYYWAVYGSGRATTPRSDIGDGRMLRLRATADEDIALNSYGIRVTPGSNFRLTVTAKLPPAGSTSGYAAAFFLWGKDNTEGYRVTLDLVAPPIPPVTVTTDAAGAINLDEALPAGRYAVRIAYAGDATHAPNVIEQEVTVR